MKKSREKEQKNSGKLKSFGQGGPQALQNRKIPLYWEQKRLTPQL